MHIVIQFNEKAWLKPYVDMKTKFRKEAKNDFEKDFFNPNFGILPPPPPPPCRFSLNHLEIVKPVTLAIYSI